VTFINIHTVFIGKQHHAIIFKGIRIHGIHTAQSGTGIFNNGCHQFIHALRVCTGISSHDDEHRHLNVGSQFHLESENGADAEYCQCQEHQETGYRSFQSKLCQIHSAASPYSSAFTGAVTSTPFISLGDQLVMTVSPGCTPSMTEICVSSNRSVVT